MIENDQRLEFASFLERFADGDVEPIEIVDHCLANYRDEGLEALHSEFVQLLSRYDLNSGAIWERDDRVKLLMWARWLRSSGHV